MVRQFYMVAKIDVPYSAIFGRPLFNELSTILSLKYLMMKCETEKGITFVKGDQMEARRGWTLVAKPTMKQLEVMILEIPEEWDR